jgi:amino acid transporter
MARTTDALKRLVIGRPMASGELEHTFLPKVLALPVFSSDPLSSNAYATQEILLVLGLAGGIALEHVFPIALAVACLLAVVVTSYRQTVRAYPAGGGAYRVSRENLGTYAGLTAASALLTDYVLTVSVSVTAGADAIISAFIGLEDFRVAIAVAAILFITFANLRGLRESGILFAIPTYGFVLTVYVLLATGFLRCLGGCPEAASANTVLRPETALSFFIILKAFSAGTTALTGVEAIADGVQAFRYPQSRNAATTLAAMGALAISMFLGISWLADHTNVVYVEGSSRTVLAQVGNAVFGEGPLFYLLQVMTAGILFLAANTAYQDFPRLSSILAGDNFMPRQLVNRGDRLVFSNGVVILALLATLLVVLFEANLNRLIQLYLVGVFISFTLSQSGMVLRWRKLKEPGWRRGMLISGFGAVVTAIVFFVIVSTKFIGGAWIVVAALPILTYFMLSIHRHYEDVSQTLKHPARRPAERRPGHHHMVILANHLDAATARAVGYARGVRPAETTAVTFDAEACGGWSRLAPDIPLHVLSTDGSHLQGVQRYLAGKRKELTSEDFLTLMVPEVLRSGSLLEVLRHPHLHRLKAALLPQPGVQVMDIPVVGERIDPNVDQDREPVRTSAVVFVSRMHNGTLQALEYAEALHPTDIRALTFALDPEEAERLGVEWLDAGVPFPLEVEDAPFRDVGSALVRYLSGLRPAGTSHVVTVVIPEFVVKSRRHQLLHGQTALILKRHLLHQSSVVTVSVPYHL